MTITALCTEQALSLCYCIKLVGDFFYSFLFFPLTETKAQELEVISPPAPSTSPLPTQTLQPVIVKRPQPWEALRAEDYTCAV